MKKKIQFCYRKIIDVNAHKQWEKLLWEDSFAEFKMQIQQFNAPTQQFYNFATLLATNSKAAQLHHLVSAAAVGYIKQLDNKIPDVLNVLGKHFLPFKQFQFEIIHADVREPSQFTVAVNFYSEALYWIDTVGNKMILILPNQADDLTTHVTQTFEMPPFLSICHYEFIEP